MKKFYVSPLVSEIGMSVELGFCQSTAGAKMSFGDYFNDGSLAEED